MKRLLTAIFYTLFGIFCIQSAYAGPFGIEMGMSLAKVKEVCKISPKLISEDRYEITPPKTNDLFESYIVWIDPDCGVYYMKAIGKDIYTNGYGERLQSTFVDLVLSIQKAYGKYEIVDEVLNNTWKDSKYFMYALSNGHRELYAVWMKRYQSNLPDDIVAILVIAKASSSDEGYVALEYEFSNYDIVKAKADSVF